MFVALFRLKKHASLWIQCKKQTSIVEIIKLAFWKGFNEKIISYILTKIFLVLSWIINILVSCKGAKILTSFLWLLGAPLKGRGVVLSLKFPHNKRSTSISNHTQAVNRDQNITILVSRSVYLCPWLLQSNCYLNKCYQMKCNMYMNPLKYFRSKSHCKKQV